jgi:hypothetical protein
MEDQERRHAKGVQEVTEETESTESVELSDEDLEEVAGGFGNKVRSAIARGSTAASNLRFLWNERIPTK